MLGRAGTTWRTIRHLKPIQVYGRLWFKLVRPRVNLRSAPSPRLKAGAWTAPAQRSPSMMGPNLFRFLNEQGALPEIAWEGPQRSRLWRYNQHYFDDLNAAGAESRLYWHQALVSRWIAENPAGKGIGWEPYPVSLRIVNWAKWALSGNELSPQALHSLAVQVRWLSQRIEWHLLGNHLLANAKALVFAGLFFSGYEAESWLKLGLAILGHELNTQILRDGGHFELSPMYHALVLEDILDLVNVSRTYGLGSFATHFQGRVPDMLRWLEVMSHPDGRISFFNDAAFGIAPENAELKAYTTRLGLSYASEAADIIHLEESGYVRLTCGVATVIADLANIGPDYLPGHAHADTLSFEMSLGCQRLIVNSGTSVYGDGSERLRQRGTAAHSTILVDGKNSSEVWSSFRVGRRAKTLQVDVTRKGHELIASGLHDGYLYLTGRPLHHRQWTLTQGSLAVLDRVTGTGTHTIEVFYHLRPGITCRQMTGTTLELQDSVSGTVVVMTVNGANPTVQPSSWHPEFGLTIDNLCIHVTLTGELPVRIETLLSWTPK